MVRKMRSVKTDSTRTASSKRRTRLRKEQRRLKDSRHEA